MGERPVAIPAKGVPQPPSELSRSLSIEVGGNTQKVTDLRPLEVFVVHDRGEASLSAVPAPVILPPQPLGDDVGGGGQLGPVQALASRVPEAHQDLVIR